MENLIKDHGGCFQAHHISYQSEQIHDLAVAFSAAQANYKLATHNRKSYKSTYADLHSILNSVRPALAANGLSFYQYIQTTKNGQSVLCSRLLHKSGQWIESRAYVIPEDETQQSYGSALSYQKRYGAMALLGVTTAEDDTDNDGINNNRSTYSNGRNRQPAIIKINKDQLEQLEYEFKNHPNLKKEFLTKLKLNSFADLPKSIFLDTIKRVCEVIQLHKDR